MSEICGTCNVVDDENHRLNFCSRFRELNLFDNAEKEEVGVNRNVNVKATAKLKKHRKSTTTKD